MRLGNETTEAHERRIVLCRGCSARIIWLKTAAGRKAPVDADTVTPGDVELDTARHTSHFATCPKADEFRKAKR